MLGQYVDLGNPLASHHLNEGRVCWLYGLPNPYTGGLYWRDAGTKQKHGLLTNGALWRTAMDGDKPAVFFDGSNDYIELGTSTVTANTVTHKIRFRMTTVTGFQGIVGWEPNSDADQFEVALNGTAMWAGNWSGRADTAAIFSAATWYTVHATSNGTNVRIYVNGADRTNTVGTTNFASTRWTQNLRIAPARSSRMGGLVAEYSLWQRGLSASEVALDYDLSRRGYPPGGPLNYWSRKTWLMGGATSPPPPPAAGGLFWWNTYGAAANV